MPTKKKRLDPKETTLRDLYIASGGLCEIDGCDKRLSLHTGAWIGTVAHIVAAEDGGPRADDSMKAEEKRDFDNLMLACADHGRAIDDPRTGERDWPRKKLQAMKVKHEQRFAGLVGEMLHSSNARARVVEDFLDTTSRKATTGGTAASFLDYMEVADDEVAATIVRELREAATLLGNLSEAARGTLIALIRLWDSRLTRGADGVDFGIDGLGMPSLEVHESLVFNREIDRQQLQSALAELEHCRFVEPPWHEADYEYRSFAIFSPWSEELTSWRMIASYLENEHRLSLADWLESLDFGALD